MYKKYNSSHTSRGAPGRRSFWRENTAGAAEEPGLLPFSPAAQRNAPFILEVLQQVLPAAARVLEVASGTGQHAQHFASRHAGWTWQPTEAQVQALPVLATRCASLPNVLPPQVLDLLQPAAPALLSTPPGFDAVYAANLLHIAPWAAAAGLFDLAARCLAPQGQLLVYGPFIVAGQAMAPSNAAFDADLRQRDARWGLRQLQQVQEQALSAGLQLLAQHAMPANNLLLRFGFMARQA